MNISENILNLAQSNSLSLRALREFEVNKRLPYFEIYKNDKNIYDVKIYNYEHHDNSPRMILWKNYLKQNILPNVINPNISGFYNIELHDSYTYLDNDIDYSGVLCFSRFKNDKRIPLIPDPYMIGNYDGYISKINDDRDWLKKDSRVCFFGTTTGSRDPSQNLRINLCKWARDFRNVCDFYITKVAQMNPKDISELNTIYKDYVPISEQLNYKYHLNIDGNTCKFDVWPMLTNNLNIRYKSKEMLWYYPMIQTNQHFVHASDFEDIIRNVLFFNNNSNHVFNMIINSKKFAYDFFKPLNHQMYTTHLFNNIE